MWAELNGGAFQRGQPFDTTYVQTDTALQFSIKFYYVNCTLYGPDDVLNRGPEAAISHTAAKLVNAAGKMGKLLATDMYLDGQGTNSGTLQLDGLQAAIDTGATYASYGNITRTDLGFGTTANAGINGYVASLSAGFSLNAVQKAFGASWFGSEKPDLLVGPQNSWDFVKLVPRGVLLN